LHRKQLLASGTIQKCELRLCRKDGTTFWAQLESSLVQDEEGSGISRITLTDISKRKQAEAEAEVAFRESQELLDELQHRAKNSFGLISNMISLTSNAVMSPESRALLSLLDARVRAISELYSLLYVSGSLTEVRLDEYCGRIAASLISTKDAVTLKMEMQAITVPVREAAPFGLILTELLTNAIKHAFPDGRRGIIVFTLRANVGGILFEVRDDGVGLPEGFPGSHSSGMGLGIVKALARQINGSFRMEGGANGTRSILELTRPARMDRK
jgi:two-component sensor histidine kinase